MKRRHFIETTGLLTAVLWTGGLGIRSSVYGGDGSLGRGPSDDLRRRPSMNGGRCQDHRLLGGDPPASFEREIFGL
jgi:hypothetical protein